jgi:hypothetical protein
MRGEVNYFTMPVFRIRRTSMKVSAVVTEMTEPNRIIRIAALSISQSFPKQRQFSLAVKSRASAKVSSL